MMLEALGIGLLKAAFAIAVAFILFYVFHGKEEGGE